MIRMLRDCNKLIEVIDSQGGLESFKKNCGFLDIETTGLSSDWNDLTVVGIYNQFKPEVFIKDRDLHLAKERVEDYNYIVSFNGDRFDIPFLKKKINLVKNFTSIDIMYPLRQLGLRGGLKKIECMLGLSRDENVVGMSGKDAIKLWKNYLRGDNRSLELLVKYNIEDIVNLEVLLNYVYFAGKSYPISKKHIIDWKERLKSRINL